MKIYISGSGLFAVQAAEAFLDAGHQVVGVASPRSKKAHGDDTDSARWDRFRSWAYPRSIPWTDSSQLRAHHLPDVVDIIVAAHSHAFIGRQTRSRARVAAIGYHPSLLPLHRGRDAVRWTIRDGDKVTGGTVYHLTDRTDAGPIAAQEHVLVPRRSTATSLWFKQLAPLGIHLLLRVVNDLANARYIAVEQDESLATWEPSMDSQPLFKPELPALPGPGSRQVEGSKWALIE